MNNRNICGIPSDPPHLLNRSHYRCRSHAPYTLGLWSCWDKGPLWKSKIRYSYSWNSLQRIIFVYINMWWDPIKIFNQVFCMVCT